MNYPLYHKVVLEHAQKFFTFKNGLALSHQLKTGGKFPTFLALEFIKVKKADSPKVLSNTRIREVIEECENQEGDVHDKAVVLLKGLVQKHPFASGNRRTDFIATKDFVLRNKSKFGVKDDPSYAKVMQGIREGYYSDKEIKEWIKNGKVKEFTR